MLLALQWGFIQSEKKGDKTMSMKTITHKFTSEELLVFLASQPTNTEYYVYIESKYLVDSAEQIKNNFSLSTYLQIERHQACKLAKTMLGDEAKAAGYMIKVREYMPSHDGAKSIYITTTSIYEPSQVLAVA